MRCYTDLYSLQPSATTESRQIELVEKKQHVLEIFKFHA